MATIEVARKKRQMRRILVTVGILAAVVFLAGLWIPAKSIYLGNVDGRALSTHYFGLFNWGALSWSSSPGQLWPMQDFRPTIDIGRLATTMACTAVLLLILPLTGLQVVRRRRTWLFSLNTKRKR